MIEDCLKLTVYFGERKRVGSQFVADALLDLYGREQIASSVLLRGVEGFGLRHHLRTDSSLSLSEDLPAVAVAVDTRERIEAVRDAAAELATSGLVTLERARMHTGDVSAVSLPAELDEATKLTVYLGRQERVHRTPAFIAVCDLLHRRGIAGATALLGVDGTTRGVRQRAHFFGRNADVPMMVIAIGSGEQIAGVLPELGRLLHTPMITLERVRVCKREGLLLATPHRLPAYRRARSGAVAETDDLQLGGRAAPRATYPPRDHPAAAGVRRRRIDDPARYLGLPRRSPAARRPPTAARSPCADGHHRDRHTRTHRRVLRGGGRARPNERGLVTSEMVPAVRARRRTGPRGGVGLANYRF